MEEETKKTNCLQTIPSLNFLKILLLHVVENLFFILNIGISIFVIMRYDTSERSFYYGLMHLLLPFIINLLFLINECHYKTELVTNNEKYILSKCFLILVILQHLPFSLFLMAMCHVDIKESYKQRLIKVNSAKNLIYACLNNIAMIFLILRNIVSWDSKTCLIDELGRTACIIYPVIIAYIFGILITIINSHNLKTIITLIC